MASKQVSVHVGTRHHRYSREGRFPNITDLPEGWREAIWEIMAEGASLSEVRAAMDITLRKWNEWFKNDEEFREVVERGLDLEHAWWMREGRTNLKNRNFNGVLWSMNMVNRFRFHARRNHEALQADDDGAKLTQADDDRLEHLFSGGDGQVGAGVTPVAKPAQAPQEAEWKDVGPARNGHGKNGKK